MNHPPTKAAQFRPPLQGNPRRTRQEHSQEIALDYVELIAELIATTGAARVTDLARRLGVTHVTVNRTIQRLRRGGLVNARPYRSILLTEAGRKLSEESRRRHEIVVEFLKSLGCSKRCRPSGCGRHGTPCQQENPLRVRETPGTPRPTQADAVIFHRLIA